MERADEAKIVSTLPQLTELFLILDLSFDPLKYPSKYLPKLETFLLLINREELYPGFIPWKNEVNIGSDRHPHFLRFFLLFYYDNGHLWLFRSFLMLERLRLIGNYSSQISI